MLSDPTLTYGERAMKALLGVDALYRTESGDPTGLTVLHMDTEGRYPGDVFSDYEEASGCFRDLRADAVDLDEDLLDCARARRHHVVQNESRDDGSYRLTRVISRIGKEDFWSRRIVGMECHSEQPTLRHCTNDAG